MALQREEAPATEPPGRPGAGEPSIELDIDEDLWQKLPRFFWSWEDFSSPGDAAGALLCFIAHPTHVHIAKGYRGSAEEVASAMVDESRQYMEMEDVTPLHRQLEDVVEHSFDRDLKAGTYDEPLRVAGFARERRGVSGGIPTRLGSAEAAAPH